MYYSNSNMYEGEWKKDARDGYGSCFILMEGTIKGFGEMIKETDMAKILIIIKSLR